MVDIEEIISKANIKEFVAVTAGLVASKLSNNVLPIKDEKQRDLAKVAIGLGGAYIANELAERSPKYGEFAALAGLAATAFAADPVADRVTIEVSKNVGVPVVVRANPPVRVVRTREVVTPAVKVEEAKPEELAIEL